MGASRRGIAHLRLGNVVDARSFLRQAQRHFDDDAVVAARLAEAEVATDWPQRARDLLEPLAKADLMPDADAWTALAKARRKTGDEEGARQALERALAMDASNTAAKALQQELAPKPEAPKAPAVPAVAPVKPPSI